MKKALLVLPFLLLNACIREVKVPVPYFTKISIPEKEIQEKEEALTKFKLREKILKETNKTMWNFDPKTKSYFISESDLILLKDLIIKQTILLNEYLKTIEDYNSKSEEEVKK